MYEKQNAGGDAKSVLTRDFLKKYICFVKSQAKPELSQEGVEYAASLYTLLRTKAQNYD